MSLSTDAPNTAPAAARPADLGRRGMLVILSSPSGAGKSTISRLLLQADTSLTLSVSVTTRAKRPSEVQGTHYEFLSEAEFARRRERGELLEWATVHGNNYGTPRDPVDTALEEGRDVLFDIDWQGADQIRTAMPDDTVSIFVLPPSGAELEARLVRRAEDDEATIRGRLKNAREELTHYEDYDYVVVNDDVESALGGVKAILTAERLRRRRLRQVDSFVASIADAL